MPSAARDPGMIIRVADFSFAAAVSSHLPPPTLPEVAFGGRSNVGKSSLLNTILERKNLVRTSKNPGCTRQINLFHAVTGGPDADLYVVDLPGYGFAARSKGERKAWGELIESYLQNRESLRALAVLVDIRRGLEPDDRQLIEFWRHVRGAAPLVLVATKLDKIPLAKRRPAMMALQSSESAKVVGFSAVTGEGKTELWWHIHRAVSRPPEPRPSDLV